MSAELDAKAAVAAISATMQATAKERKDIRNSLIDELASIILGNPTKSIRDMGVMDKYFNLHQAVTIVPLIENQSSKASKND